MDLAQHGDDHLLAPPTHHRRPRDPPRGRRPRPPVVRPAATTDTTSPPRGRRRCVPWLAAGFLMSVLWAYTLRASWWRPGGDRYPTPFTLPADAAVYETVGFLCAGLAWALVVVPARGMRLDRVYGVGLVVIYLAFFGVRVLDSLGLWFG
ncbi:hypothetical protein ZWY2020_037701 [Hordeum vulgare]|nr:hypothetical protein ZWY2020_037701 [Hordeum vulgare]